MTPTRFWIVAAIVACFAVCGEAALVSTAVAKELPGFDEVTAAAEKALHADPRYESGDLITRKQVVAVVNELERLGWKLEDRRKFEKLALEDGSFLVKQLTSTNGKKFLRQISSMPLAIDRLDRMSQMKLGHSTVERLVRGPDGYKLFDYMTNAKGGHELAKMLTNEGNGNFDKPTGKLYTEAYLMRELKEMYAEALEAMRKAALRTTARN